MTNNITVNTTVEPNMPFAACIQFIPVKTRNNKRLGKIQWLIKMGMMSAAICILEIMV